MRTAWLFDDVEYVDVPCPYGNCTIWVHPPTGIIDGSAGLMTCPCDNTPGWKSRRIQGMGKPHPPVLPKGRHRSRIERARRRHRLPDYLS